MSIRIRYSKSQDKRVLNSKNVYHHPSNGARYRVQIDLNSLTWTILDDASNIRVTAGAGKHPHKLKIAAKEALMDLGIPLTPESRDRKVKTNLV
jgi:hypothetical protein